MSEDVTVVSTRGQVVIPQDIRKRMRLKPKDRLVVFGEKDTIIMKRLELPELKEAWERLGKVMKARNKKYGKLTQAEIDKEIADHRAGR